MIETVKETTLDMMRLDDLLQALQYQILAYQKVKQMDYQTIMVSSINAISILCKQIDFVIKEEKRVD